LASEGRRAREKAGQPPADDGAKRRQIMEGAREILHVDAGFDGASMNDIARAAGVSKGTLYAYFDSKVRLFEALIREDRAHQPERNTMFPRDEPDPAKRWRFTAARWWRNVTASGTRSPRPGWSPRPRRSFPASAKRFTRPGRCSACDC
jgi:AcrR family transcriptional regulator